MMGAAVDAVAGQSDLTAKQAVLQVLVGKMGLGAEWAAANMSRLQGRVRSVVRRHEAMRKRKRDAQPGGAAAEEHPLLPQSEGGGGDKSSSSSDDDSSGDDIDVLASAAGVAAQHRNYLTAA